MNRVLLLLAAVAVSGAAVPAADGPHATVPDRYRATLDQFCSKCHNEKKQSGKFRFDDLPYAVTTIETAERWQKVLNALNAGEMPPEGEKPLPSQVKADFLDDLANVMVAARRGLGDQRGLVTMRRLNRREYRNTLRELLGVEINVSELPADTGTGGFDTAGSNLFMSGNQFEQYLALSREALDEAFERFAAEGVTKKLHYEAESSLPKIADYAEYEIDARERAEKWVKAVEEAAARPENAAVVAEIRKTAKNDAIFRRSWERIAGAPSPESFGFLTKENNADKANSALNPGNLPYHQYYLRQPHVKTGAYLTVQTVHPSKLDFHYITLVVPDDWPVGEYVLRVRMGATEQATADQKFIIYGIHPRKGQVLSTHEVTGTVAAPRVIEIPVSITRKHADRSDRTLFIRQRGTGDHNDQARDVLHDGKKQNGIGPDLALWVDWLELERLPTTGVASAPGLAALAGVLKDDPAPAELRAGLERFARAAYRGTPPPAGSIDKLMGVYAGLRGGGASHPDALKETLSVVLASPMFLYLAEPSSDGHRPLTGPELATRLSYFVWGAPPDAELLRLAAAGELAKPDVLKAQTDRLLDDPRSDGFVRPFAYQWLGLDRLDFFQVSWPLYPRFDAAVQFAAKNEIYETVEYLVRENGGLRDLLKADYVVANNVLARYYGLDGVAGDGFRKVPLPAGSPRGGLLGMAAVCLMGGNGERTSPVERGAWVLRKLLDDPPPPAPANVPQIARLADKLLTTRERMRMHQEEPQCASCHRKIDPIGFGLENFDAVGQWRTEDRYEPPAADGQPKKKAGEAKTWVIDPAAAFHKGPAFKDFFGLRDIIAGKSDAFARGFSTALAEYALGRPTGFADAGLIEAMTTRGKSDGTAIRTYIHALVASKEFHTK